MILGLDTTGRDLKLGLSSEGGVRRRLFSNDLRHSRQILPQILQFLEEEGEDLKSLQALAFSQGPGSFTGLRIAVGVIQGLAYGLNLPVIPVPTMAIVAQAAGQQAGVARVLIAMHAREEEFYGAFYEGCDGLIPRLMGQAEVYTAGMLANHDLGSWSLSGDGVFLMKEQAHAMQGTIDTASPDVQNLLQIARVMFAAGDVVSALEAAPLYVRETVAQKSRQ
jgi:tRNA threonylcarbamoyladenosine biosynthesis protein TsaB